MKLLLFSGLVTLLALIFNNIPEVLPHQGSSSEFQYPVFTEVL